MGWSKKKPQGYSPIGGGVESCPEWYFLVYLNRGKEYLIKPKREGKCEIYEMTEQRRKQYLFVGDTKSGKASDGKGSYSRFKRATQHGDDENSPVGTPSLGGYGERTKSTVVDDEGNAAEGGELVGGEKAHCRGANGTAGWPSRSPSTNAAKASSWSPATGPGSRTVRRQCLRRSRWGKTTRRVQTRHGTNKKTARNRNRAIEHGTTHHGMQRIAHGNSQRGPDTGILTNG